MNKLSQIIDDWKLSCIIFDLDGTLTDTLDLHIKAFEMLFQELEVVVPKEKIRENMGRTPKDILLTLTPNLVVEEKNLTSYANRKEEILSTLFDEVRTFAGAKKLVEQTRIRGITSCLASSTPEFNVKKILQAIKFEGFFDYIITGEDISIGKPHPQAFLEASRKAKRKPEECCVIGDSIHDVLAAQRAGMKIVAVTTGKHTIEQLKELNPDMVISSLQELLG